MKIVKAQAGFGLMTHIFLVEALTMHYAVR